jgi:hypothetical protein
MEIHSVAFRVMAPYNVIGRYEHRVSHKTIHTTHSQCVNTGQCGESSRKINVPEDGHIRPKDLIKLKPYFVSIP